MKRIPEPESMNSIEEAIEYDKIITDTEVDFIDDCFAYSVHNLGITEGKLLDMGIGTGRIAMKIAKIAPSLLIVGVDSSPAMLEIADENIHRCRIRNIVLARGDITGLHYEEASFDAVISNNTLHHLERPELALREARRLAKHDGAIIIRDLRRPFCNLAVNLYVHFFASSWSNVQRELYKASLKAGFTKAEFSEMAKEAGMRDFVSKNYLISHVGVEKYRKCVRLKPLFAPNRPLTLREKLIIKHYVTF